MMPIFRERISAKLTHDPELAKKANLTFPGQAHFADDQSGMTCRECLHWQHRAGDYFDNGSIKPARCAKYTALTGKPGKPVPEYAKACRHFSLNAATPKRFK